MDYLIAKFTGIQASPFGKGFVAGYSISWMAAIIGALIYGVVDYFLPGTTRM